MSCWLLAALVLVAGVLLSLPPVQDALLPDKEAPVLFEVADTGDAPRDLYLSDEQKYNFGRWTSPIVRPVLHPLTVAQALVQKKEWEFVAFSTSRYLIGLAVGQLSYAGTGFVYVFDALTSKALVHTSLLPLGLRTQVSNSSIDGCSSYSFMSLAIAICRAPGAGPDDTRYQVTASAVFPDSTSLSLNVHTSSRQNSGGALVLSYPIGPKRAAYTHKISGMKVQGTAELRAMDATTTTIPLAVGLSDWTRSMHWRLTQWFWVALTWEAAGSGDRVGINLSHGVYPHPRGAVPPSAHKQVGMENAVWLNDRVHFIEAPLVVQGVPGQGHVAIGQEWRCYTEGGGALSLDLTFTPRGVVPSSVHAYVLSCDLLHHFGVYNGRVVVGGKTFEVVNLPGILEDHFAWW